MIFTVHNDVCACCDQMVLTVHNVLCACVVLRWCWLHTMLYAFRECRFTQLCVCLCSDGAGAEEGGGEDKQCGAWGHWQVSTAVGANSTSVQCQVPWRGLHHHPRGEISAFSLLPDISLCCQIRYQPSLCCQISAFSLMPDTSLLFAARC